MDAQVHEGVRVEVWAWAGERGVRAMARSAGRSACVTSQALARDARPGQGADGTDGVIAVGGPVVRDVPISELVATVIGLLPPDPTLRAGRSAATVVIAVSGRPGQPAWAGSWVGGGSGIDGGWVPTHDHGRDTGHSLESIGQALVWALTAVMAP
jgi:hypothetical protein